MMRAALQHHNGRQDIQQKARIVLQREMTAENEEIVARAPRGCRYTVPP
jgi:hypothetical protein